MALDPGTPLTMIEPLMDELEMIVVLAVNPGWGGQKFIPDARNRLQQAKEMIHAAGRSILLALDGGVTRDNIGQIAAMGPDLIVAGSAVFDGKAPADNARFLLGQLKQQP